MSTNKISVVVPVYNTEEYLPRCLDSILSQTYKDLEIILVNDGSTDSSGEICNLYSQQDDRIKVIHKENGGLSSARNIAIEISRGNYIVFVDSDDWIVEDIYEHCVDVAETMKCDVVDFQCVFTNGEIINTNSIITNKIELVEGKEILRDYLLRGQTEKSPFSSCRKLYKRELFATVRFPEGKINEDIATNYKVLMNCNRIAHTSKIGYFYFQDSRSTTRNGLKKRDFDLLDACKELKKLSQNEEYQDIKYLVNVKYVRSYFSLLAKVAFYGISDCTLNRKEVIRSLSRKIRGNYFLLMRSPMPFNRKIMVTALCINIKCLSMPLKLYKMLNRK